ncbi:carbohydrate ABC transporter permease [Neobacillus vireti]|uniref:Binding-protein-dependent transport system membrane protein n=1 Tax=Neobacillus vireti LMG 21834 TaxID=1131730 RepID=A0AB94IFX8_9BACI|nr:sugar ABC transporter permease [Neobacillus vireti]ETI66016.1 binding-protein-dependent transport system membrane protein [Neobacillus vireti LMG 21834]
MGVPAAKLKSNKQLLAIKRPRRKLSLTPLLFILPAIIPLIIFWIYPMGKSLYISFTDWDYISPEYDFVGFSNYTDLLTDPGFYSVLVNTVVFSMGVVIPCVAGGLMLALLVSGNGKGMGIYRTLIFSPWVTPTVAVSIVWSWIYEPNVGLANWVLNLLQLPALGWTSSSTWAMPAVIIVSIWKGVGWAMIFYLNALKKVPVSLYEAASLDGASKWRQFLHITIPFISPTTLFLIVITSIDALQAYDQIQVLTQGGPAGSTRTMLYFYYQTAFEEFNMGKATATAILLVVITAAFSFFQFIFSKRWVHYQ